MFVEYIYIYIYMNSTIPKRHAETLQNWNISFQLKKRNTYRNGIDNLDSEGNAQVLIRRMQGVVWFWRVCFTLGYWQLQKHHKQLDCNLLVYLVHLSALAWLSKWPGSYKKATTRRDVTWLGVGVIDSKLTWMISIDSGYEDERVIEWLVEIGVFLGRMEIVDFMVEVDFF